MKYIVEYTDTAKNDLRKIVLYIAEETKNIDIALKFINEIESTIDILKDFPQSGALPKDRILLSFDYRYLIHGNYLIFYKVAENNSIVFIEAIFNAKQDYMRIMKKYI